MVLHIENSRTLAQWFHNSTLTTVTKETEALHRLHVSSWEQTPLLGPFFDNGSRLQEDGHALLAAGTAKWVRDWEYERLCLHGDKEGVLQLLLVKVAKECRLKNKTDILRQVSPTQSHQSNGAAEKAVSAVRGLARTYLTVIRDKIASFGAKLLEWAFEVTFKPTSRPSSTRHVSSCRTGRTHDVFRQMAFSQDTHPVVLDWTLCCLPFVVASRQITFQRAGLGEPKSVELSPVSSGTCRASPTSKVGVRWCRVVLQIV